MKAATLRIFLSVHTWVGLVAGMALFIAFYAGAITVFTHELGDWQRPADAQPATDPIGRSQALLDALLAKHPESAESVFLVLPGEHGPQPSAYWYNEETREQRRFVLDAAGALRETPARTGVVDFVYDLHFTAGLPRTFGTYLFGVVCILYGLALVSGVVLYAPAFLKDLFALRIGRNVKRLWQDAHNVVGVLSLPFHVIFAWSGAVLTIGTLILAPFQFLVYEGKLLQVLESDFEVAPHVAPAGVAKPMLPVAELLRRAETALPGLEVNSVGYHDAGDANGQATVYGELAQRRLSNTGAVALDAATGAVVVASEPRAYSPGRAFLYALYSLHFGSFGQYTVKWLYFVLGLAGAFLFFSGNLLWVEARRKRRQVEQPQRTRVMAALTLGACLGCIAGVSAAFLAGALLPEAWAPRAYFIVFFASLAWAFARAPARAGHELLWLCAALTALVPLAGAIGSGEHLFASFARGHWHRFFVDATALALAFAYWRMARATLRRGVGGDPNSVWALRR
ncbi:MAG: PepSY-associated TM helix domain-containing protein [Pseudoxanthomonas sp.]